MADRDLNVDSPTSLPSPESPAQFPLRSPTSPISPSLEQHSPSLESPRHPSIDMTTSATTGGMTTSSTPLGGITAARRPAPPAPSLSSRGSGLNVNQDIQARMKAFHLGRQGAPPMAGRSPLTPSKEQPVTSPPTPSGGALAGGIPANFQLPGGMKRGPSSPAVPNAQSPKLSLAEKRGLALPGGLPGRPPVSGAASSPAPTGGRKKPGLTLSQMKSPPNGDADTNGAPPKQETLLDKYADYLDTKTGALSFKGKAVLDSQGVRFAGGHSFSISLDEVDTLDELGKGNYGTVYKVRHSRPKMRRPGQGLAGNKSSAGPSPASPVTPTNNSPRTVARGGTGVVMAMKEIRLELDDAKFAAIIMELDILHRCLSPYIVDFYGAFFQEGAVYICLEFMDGGSIDKLYGDGIPENVLRKITLATTMGLKSLKDEHNIIHRDVKPTNILCNTRGQVKICDFGVSGNLVASIAKTNIGCQSYMAPERISSGGVAQAGANPGGGTYSVQSDIWSLGLTIIECALGRYPYPPETYNNIFSQLSAIVDGEPPDLPSEGFSDAAHNFVSGCLNKIPNLRPTYAMLLEHAWLAPLVKPPTIQEEDEEAAELATATDSSNISETSEESASKSEELPQLNLPSDVVDKDVSDWVLNAIERRRTGQMAKSTRPPLHTAPLDAVQSPGI